MPERGSKTSTVPVVWANLEFFRSDPNDFLSRLVIMEETWLYHFDPETKQQSVEWGHSSSHCPKISECKNPLEKFSPRFFGIKTASSSFIVFQRAKMSKRSITHLCWCSWRTFWKKNAAGNSPRESCSCTTMPRLTEHLQPRINWPTWASNVLITHHILQSGPIGLPPGPWTEKNNWKVAIFRPTRRSLLPWRPGWTDNLLNYFFLSDLLKLEQRTKKCIELRGEYVE